MDKKWMQLPRWSKEYFIGMHKFLDFAFEKVGTHGKINCPCKKCSHRMWYDRGTVVDHLIYQGFSEGYTHWIYHGETSKPQISKPRMIEQQNLNGSGEDTESDDMPGMPHDTSRVSESEDVSDDNGIRDCSESSSCKKRKGRGKTIMKEYWSGMKPKVSLEWNEHGQPVGDGATILSSYIGVVARSGLLPLPLTDWRHVDKEAKNAVINHIKTRFDLDGDKNLHWTLGKLGERWRDFKHRLHRDYVADLSEHDALLNFPSHVNPDDWRPLIRYFFSDEFKKKSKKNATNRSQSKTSHNTGRRSLATRAKDLQKNHPLGMVPSRHELWKLIRTRKNGEPINEYCGDVFSAIDEYVAGMEEKEEGEIDDGPDVLGAVLGNEHSGRVRGMGSGVIPSKYFRGGRGRGRPCSCGGTSNHLQEQEQLQEQVQEQVKEQVQQQVPEQVKQQVQDQVQHQQVQEQAQKQVQQKVQEQVQQQVPEQVQQQVPQKLQEQVQWKVQEQVQKQVPEQVQQQVQEQVQKLQQQMQQLQEQMQQYIAQLSDLSRQH